MASATTGNHASSAHLQATHKDEVLAKLAAFDLTSPAAFTCFQSTDWIETWIESVARTAEFVTYENKTNGVATSLAVLGRKRLLRHRVVASNSVWLWETGNPLLDRLSVEYNRPLSSSDQSADAAILDLVRQFDNDERYDELYVSGAFVQDSAVLDATAAKSSCAILGRSPTYWIDLAAIRAKQSDILGSLSSNTRSQVRRAIKKLEQTGPLTLQFASGSEQCSEWFDLMRPMHETRWQSASREGAFANPLFETFHKALIRRAAPGGNVRVARLLHGDKAISYQYYLIRGRNAYSYQSAFVADPADKQIKPGLVAHVLAAQQMLSEGFDTYDLLAGHSQYKESLATNQGEMLWLRWQKPRLRFYLERQARAAYKKLKTLLEPKRERTPERT